MLAKLKSLENSADPKEREKVYSRIFQFVRGETT